MTDTEKAEVVLDYLTAMQAKGPFTTPLHGKAWRESSEKLRKAAHGIYQSASVFAAERHRKP